MDSFTKSDKTRLYGELYDLSGRISVSKMSLHIAKGNLEFNKDDKDVSTYECLYYMEKNILNTLKEQYIELHNLYYKTYEPEKYIKLNKDDI